VEAGRLVLRIYWYTDRKSSALEPPPFHDDHHGRSRHQGPQTCLPQILGGARRIRESDNFDVRCYPAKNDSDEPRTKRADHDFGPYDFSVPCPDGLRTLELKGIPLFPFLNPPRPFSSVMNTSKCTTKSSLYSTLPSWKTALEVSS
jgi:hypothetical protein